MSNTDEYADNITIPDGEDWWCAECGAIGDSEDQTMREHYEKEHPDIL